MAMDGGSGGVVHLCEAMMDAALDAEIEGDCRARVHRARDGGAAVFAKVPAQHPPAVFGFGKQLPGDEAGVELECASSELGEHLRLF